VGFALFVCFCCGCFLVAMVVCWVWICFGLILGLFEGFVGFIVYGVRWCLLGVDFV